MFREFTFTDVDRIEALNNADASAGFVMDEETFRAFYDRTARGVWVYLSRVTGDRQMADDLLQETFYRFLRAGPRRMTAKPTGATLSIGSQPISRAMPGIAISSGPLPASRATISSGSPQPTRRVQQS